MFYLAYGSNLLPGRLLERVDSARPVAIHRLQGYRLVFHKVGRDGSGKCDLVVDPGAVAYGVVYTMDASGRQALDAHEGPDYRVAHLPLAVGSDRVQCFCYVARSECTDPAMVPFEWYRALVHAGGMHHGLPADYLDRILQVPVRRDPDRQRHQRHWRLLP